MTRDGGFEGFDGRVFGNLKFDLFDANQVSQGFFWGERPKKSVTNREARLGGIEGDKVDGADPHFDGWQVDRNVHERIESD